MARQCSGIKSHKTHGKPPCNGGQKPIMDTMVDGSRLVSLRLEGAGIHCGVPSKRLCRVDVCFFVPVAIQRALGICVPFYFSFFPPFLPVYIHSLRRGSVRSRKESLIKYPFDLEELVKKDVFEKWYRASIANDRLIKSVPVDRVPRQMLGALCNGSFNSTSLNIPLFYYPGHHSTFSRLIAFPKMRCESTGRTNTRRAEN